MEFRDVVYGLWGFIAIFAVYFFIRVAIYLLNKLLSGKTKRRIKN